MSHDPLSVVKRWKVYINDVEYPYVSIDFEKVHPSPDPDTFTITLSGKKSLSFFSPISIKKDNVQRFYGYVEDIDYEMGADGVNTITGGRCRKVILWKKWTERFTDTRLAGFFGKVYPEELVKFLLRCPISDVPHEDYPRRKIGWGLDSDYWECSANRTGIGFDPSHVRIRVVGLYWRNEGGGDDVDTETDPVDGWNEIQKEWTDEGDPPWLDVDDETGYVTIDGNNPDSWMEEWTFSDLPAGSTGIDIMKLYINCRGAVANALIAFDVYLYDGTEWKFAGEVREKHWAYEFAILDVTSILDTVAKVNAAKMKLQAKMTIYWGRIRYAKLVGLVQKLGGGSGQAEGDWFLVDLGEQKSRVTGVLIESRHSEDQYARNYKIEILPQEGSVKSDFNDFAETDPNTHIGIVGTDHVDFDAYRNETAYLVLDKGAGYFTDFEHKVDFRCGDPAHLGGALDICFCPYLLSDVGNKDIKAMETDNDDFILIGVRHDAVGPWSYISICEQWGGGNQTWDSYNGFVANTWYYLTIIKVGTSFTVNIYSDSGRTVLLDTLHVTLNSAHSFRYIYASNTYNNTVAANVDGDIENLYVDEDWIQKASKTTNLARDILHSWSPCTVRKMRITITANEPSVAWEITQIYIYQADDADYTVLESTISPNISLVESNIKSKSASPYVIEKPINMPFQRLTEAMNQVCMGAFDLNYDPWEWWIAESDGKIYFDERKGSPKADKIFEANLHLARATKGRSITKTAQRLRVVGRGEGKRQDEATSQWKDDATAIASAGTFYEELVSEKTISNLETADAWAEVYLRLKKDIIEEIEVDVERDPYDSGSWDVGDDVKLKDLRVDIAEQLYRIKRLHIHVDGQKGEVINLTVTNAWEDITDKIADLYRKVRRLQFTGTETEDWIAEGTGSGKISGKKIDTLWSTTRQEEVDEPLTEAEIDRTRYGIGNGADVDVDDQNLWIKGGNNGFGGEVGIYMANNTVSWDRSPRLEMKIRIMKETEAGDSWEDGDYAYLRTYDPDAGYEEWIGFRIQKESGSYILYAIFRDYLMEGGQKAIAIQTILHDTTYKLEAVVDWDNKLAMFYVDGEYKTAIPFSVGISSTGSALQVLRVCLGYNNTDDVNAFMEFYEWKITAQHVSEPEEWD